jgi:hypothetical protein
MRSWVSCEEKLALLERMYRLSHESLDEKDEAAYRDLRRELARRVESVRILTDKVEYDHTEKPPQSDRRTKPVSPKAQTKPLSELEPEDVVRLFVSCWDAQDFQKEYALLSDTFRRAGEAPKTLEEYVKQRKAKYSARILSGQIAKCLDSIVGTQVSGTRALIDCIEIRKWHTSSAAQRRRYHLRQYSEGWKIDYFETLVS